MCGRKSGRRWLLPALLWLLLSSPCFSDVVLTDGEAEEMLREMESARTELQLLKEELTESEAELKAQKEECQSLRSELTPLRTESAALSGELNALKAACGEQKRYYEELLDEARKARTVPWILAAVEAVLSFILALALIF